MALPGDINTIILTGTYLDTAGNALSGTVSFVPSTPVLIDTVGTVILGGVGVTVALNGSGAFSVVLPCTGQLSPGNWAWTVTETVTNLPRRTYSVSLPHSLGSTVDLSTLTPVVPGTITVNTPAWVSVQSYGAVGDGVTDDTGAIQSALNATPPGGITYLPPAVYAVSSPITLPTKVTLYGVMSVNPNDAGDVGPVLKPTAGFVGASVLLLTDPGSVTSYGGSVMGVAIDGINAAVAVDGIRGHGPVIETVLRDVSISNMTGWGINTTVDGSATGAQYPFQWNVQRVMVDACGAGGVSLTSMTDSTWDNVYVLFCGQGSVKGPGWLVTWAGNSKFSHCRSEFSGTVGWHLTGAWYTGAGAGGMTMIGCSTDRSEQHGVLVDATGNGPLFMDGLMLRRDGRNGNSGGGSFAGLSIASATVPVIVGGVTVFPGVDDNGTGTNSPQIGVAASGSPLASVVTGYVQAATTAVSNTTSGGYFSIGSGMITAVGTVGSPGSYTGQTQVGFEAFANIIYANAGIDTAASAPVLTPVFTNGTATLLADVTRDYMVYLVIGTAGTANTLAIGPTVTPSVTLISSATATAGEVMSFRLPAGWYVKWSATTATLATQKAVGC